MPRSPHQHRLRMATIWPLWLIVNRDVPPHAAECIAAALSTTVWGQPTTTHRLRRATICRTREDTETRIPDMDSATLLRRVATVVLRRRIRCNHGTQLRRFAAQNSASACDDLPH